MVLNQELLIFFQRKQYFDNLLISEDTFPLTQVPADTSSNILFSHNLAEL